MARVVRGSDRVAAAGYLLAAADKYSLALHLHAANPQVSWSLGSSYQEAVLGQVDPSYGCGMHVAC